MDEKDPMEIEREREGSATASGSLTRRSVPGAGSSLEDPDAAEEDDLLEGNVDDEREAGV